ncbi:MAG: SoxR reducing system RseC family protein [Silanimonas sp.]
MSVVPAGESDRIHRRAVVVAVEGGALSLRWTESRCRGCVGCGGRCGLFAASSSDTDTVTLTNPGGAFAPGTEVDVEVAASALRRGAGRAYGIAIAALLVGAAAGHALGASLGDANLGALCGLLLGTFLAGRLTKRPDASPPLRVRPCPESENKELPR